MKRMMTITIALMTLLALATWADELTETQLTGRLTLAESQAPSLQADGEDYILRVAPTLAAELDLRSGQTITVDGYVHERGRWDLTGVDRVVMVTAIESEGVRVVMPETGFAGGRMGTGGMGTGHMHGRGPMGGRGAWGDRGAWGGRDQQGDRGAWGGNDPQGDRRAWGGRR